MEQVSGGGPVENELTAIEIDLRLTKDGELILRHDSWFPKKVIDPAAADGERIGVDALSSEQVRSIRYSATVGGKLWEDVKVVFADDLAKVTKGKVNLHLDVKNVPARKVIEFIRLHDIQKESMVMSGSIDYLEAIHTAEPDVCLEYTDNTLGRRKVDGQWQWYPVPRQHQLYHELMKALRAAGVDALCTKGLTREKVAICHQYGILVRTSASHMKTGRAPDPFLRMGVDYALTDDPLLMKTAVRKLRPGVGLSRPGQTFLELIRDKRHRLRHPATPPGGAPSTRGPAFADVVCQGTYHSHLQGIATDEAGTIYWSFTRDLVKTDRAGRILERVAVRSHHGDLTCHGGKVYVAVNFGAFNKEAGQADSWVYVYDARDLSLVSKHEVPELVHGAGGMAYHNGCFTVIGGLPETHKENYVYEYDENFKFLKRHVLPSGYTRLGIQTTCWANGAWWFGCYGNKLLKTDDSFRLLGKYEFDCSVGIVGLAGNQFLIGRWSGKRHRGEALLAHADPSKGMILGKPGTAEAKP